MIWTLKLYKNDYLISGDSVGEVVIWDANHGTQLYTFNQLKADVLTLESNTTHGLVYASGVDSRVLAL